MTVLVAHGGELIGPHDLWASWSLDPFVLAAIAVSCSWYAAGVRRLWRSAGSGGGVTRGQATAFARGTAVIVSDRSWRTAFGAYVTDAWYSGSDYDARRDPLGWDWPGADLSDTAPRRDGTAVGWIDAGIAPPPNLATELVARDAPVLRFDAGGGLLSRRRVPLPFPASIHDFGLSPRFAVFYANPYLLDMAPLMAL